MDRRKRFFITKALRYLIILFVIITLNFLIPRVMPGDPVSHLLGENFEVATAEELQALNARYGLDLPITAQYFRYLANIVRLDFGYSVISEGPVTELIGEALQFTLVLVLPSVLLSGFLSLILGTIAGFRRDSPFDKTITAGVLLLYTTPSFFLAMIFVSVFSYHLNWFPLGQLVTGGHTGLVYYLDMARHLVLPVVVLTLFGSLSKYMVVRSATTHVLDDYFVFVLRSKGFSRKHIVNRHVIKNILPQFISMMALSFGFMVSGSLLVEIVFSIDGMGGLIFEAVKTRDYPVLQGAFLMITIAVLLANFTADLLYAATDPRIGDSQQSGYQA